MCFFAQCLIRPKYIGYASHCFGHLILYIHIVVQHASSISQMIFEMLTLGKRKHKEVNNFDMTWGQNIVGRLEIYVGCFHSMHLHLVVPLDLVVVATLIAILSIISWTTYCFKKLSGSDGPSQGIDITMHTFAHGVWRHSFCKFSNNYILDLTFHLQST